LRFLQGAVYPLKSGVITLSFAVIYKDYRTKMGLVKLDASLTI